MNRKPHPSSSSRRYETARRPSPGIPRELLEQRPIYSDQASRLPQVEVRLGGALWHPFIFRKQLGQISRDALPGDLVELISPGGEVVGYGLFNPEAEISVRVLRSGQRRPDDAWWSDRLAQAVSLRRETLRLDDVTQAYRLIHAEADGLPGLVVDRFGDVLVAECFSLGMYQRAEAIMSQLEVLAGTRHGVLRAAPMSQDHEGFSADAYGSADCPARATIVEYGTKFRINFAGGHKTGFYCDQRDNRKRLAEFCGGKSVLDLCCYTGGFALQAKCLGQAGEVTGVELDEDTVVLARENAHLNQVKINFVQSEVFGYMRDMLRNRRKFDVVVLDPPKLIRGRGELEEGRHKYFDLNRLAMQLVNPGGILLTCSCSGLLDMAEFTRIVNAAPEVGRRGQILAKGGAAPDHPISTNCPESEYLKTIWVRMD
jgi:23S rRNA (cytosine1962-C5)-methyltransferase